MQNSLRFLALAFVATFAVRLCAADLSVPDTVLFEQGIEYSRPGGQRLDLNLARPKKVEGLAPAVLCIHGGGFRAGSRDGHNALCVKLAERGFVAATASYRLAPQHPFPAAVHDVKAAVRWLRANAAKYQIDPALIGVTGDSAGGHLAQFLGVTAGVAEFEGDGGHPAELSSVACVVNKYGPSDFTQSYGKSVDAAEVLPLFLGGNLETAREAHLRASPLNWITPNAAPTLILHGTEDKYVAYEQAVWTRDRLRACGVEVELLTLEGAGHGFKGADAEKAGEALVNFLEKHLRRYTQLPAASPDGIGKAYMGREIAAFMTHAGAPWLERPERDAEEHTEKVLSMLPIKAGDTVADVGAGTGYYTRRIARLVQPGGKVYAVEIQQEMLDLLKVKLAELQITNVVTVLGTITDPNLPPASTDLLLMVDVYHECSHPYEMLRNMTASLKVGGKMVFVEYKAEDPNVPIKRLHKMTEAQVRKEAEVHPLRWVETRKELPWQHMIIFEKLPAPTAP